MTELPLGVRHSVAIDWVTLTWPRGSEMYEGRDYTIRGVLGLMDKQAGSGFMMNKWSGQGYVGWRAGGVKLGWRDDTCILVLSGAEAPKVEYMIGLDEARCTRLDISTTIWWEGERPDLMELATVATTEFREGREGKPYTIDPRRPDPGSKTLYIGRRGKSIFLRVYDKQEESSEDEYYRGSWRVEAELAKDTANDTFHAIRRTGFELGALRRMAAAAYAYRGLRFAGWEDLGPFAVPPGTAALTDAGRKLAWLDRTVAPSVRWLVDEVGLNSVLEALGLRQSYDRYEGGI